MQAGAKQDGKQPAASGGPPQPGNWADELCLAPSMETNQQEFTQWTDVDLFFDRYVGELTNIVEKDSSQDESQAAAAQESEDPEGKEAAMPSSDPSAIAGTNFDLDRERNSETAREKPKVKRWKNRTPKQHQDNILAQRRYRQRKKAKVQGLQQQIEELNVQLQKLEATTNEVRQLEQRNQEYEQQLWSQHAEVKRIQEQLQERARISSATDHYKERTDKVGGSRQQQLERATNEWLRQTIALAELLDRQGVQPSPTDEAVSPDDAKAIDAAMHSVMDLCKWALSLGDLDLSRLIHATEGSANRSSPEMVHGRTAVSSETPDYQGVCQELKLSPEQLDRAAKLWQQVHEQMQSIWEQRHALHDEWCDLVSRESAPNHRTQALWSILEKLQDNLRDEQRAYCQQHHLVFRQLLSHTQDACGNKGSKEKLMDLDLLA